MEVELVIIVLLSYRIRNIHWHFIYLGAVVQLYVPQDLDIVTLHKVHSNTLQPFDRGKKRATIPHCQLSHNLYLPSIFTTNNKLRQKQQYQSIKKAPSSTTQHGHIIYLLVS